MLNGPYVLHSKIVTLLPHSTSLPKDHLFKIISLNPRVTFQDTGSVSLLHLLQNSYIHNSSAPFSATQYKEEWRDQEYPCNIRRSCCVALHIFLTVMWVWPLLPTHQKKYSSVPVSQQEIQSYYCNVSFRSTCWVGLGCLLARLDDGRNLRYDEQDFTGRQRWCWWWQECVWNFWHYTKLLRVSESLEGIRIFLSM